MTLEEIEAELGNPADLTLTSENRSLLYKWARAKGYKPQEYSIAAIVNMYHEKAMFDNVEKAPDANIAMAADMFVKIVTAVNTPGFNVDLTRKVANDQFRISFEKWLSADIDARIAKLPPKQLHIISATGSALLQHETHYMTETVIKIASLAHAIMLVGPAGCGKTTIGNHVAEALQFPFYITSTINDTHELTGFVDGYGKYHMTPFRRAFEFGGVWVADEIDAWDAAALLAANSALANGYSVFPDKPEPVGKHPNFRMIATANTFGNGADRVYIGRNELDAASLDRFATINVDYDVRLEQLFSNGHQNWLDHVWKIREIVNEKRIRHVVSSRAISMGAAALAIGLPWNEVEEIYLLKGMSEADRKKLK